MAQYPTRGTSPWDEPLKTYLDSQIEADMAEYPAPGSLDWDDSLKLYIDENARAASPFSDDTAIAQALFASLKAADTGVAVNKRCLLLGDSTSNQYEEWFGLGWNAVKTLWPTWKVLYYSFNSATSTWDAPTELQLGSPVGTPAPVNGVTTVDNFARTVAELIGTPTDSGGIWAGPIGYYSVTGGRATQVGNTTGLALAHVPVRAKGDMTATAKMGITNTLESSSRIHRFAIKYLSSTNFLLLNFSGTTTKTIIIQKSINGVATTIATMTSGAIPANTPYAEYNVSFSCVGTDVSATVNGVTVTGVITADDAAVLADAQEIGWGSNSPTATLDNLSVSVNGFSTVGDYRTLRIYNAAVPGTTLDYQTANPARLAAILAPGKPDQLVLSGGHNYDAMAVAPFQTAVVAAKNAVFAATGQACPVVLHGQNPEYEPKTQVNRDAHNARQRAQRQFADAQGWGYIPGFETMWARSDHGKSLVDADGVHTRYTGSLLDGNGSMLLGDTWAQWIKRANAAA